MRLRNGEDVGAEPCRHDGGQHSYFVREDICVPSLFALSARRASLSHVRRVVPVPPAEATGVVAAVYRRMEAEFGLLAPPVALHAPAPEVLAAVWVILRETLLTGDPGQRAARELVAAAVSRANTCPYCVEVHGAALAGVGPPEVAPGVVSGDLAGIADPRLRDLARWAGASGERDSERRAPAPFEMSDAPSFIGVATTFHYINRMVTLFLGDSPLLPIPRGGHGVARRAAVRVFGRFARVSLRPGLCNGLLPAAPIPDDLAWAVAAPVTADALARGYAAIEKAGAAALPPGVRAAVAAHLDDRYATGPGLADRDWLAARLSDVAPGDRPLARLALLAAWAPHRVTDTHVDELRADGLNDKALISAASWASLAVARRAGVRLYRDLPTVRDHN
jgi:AhpD family alkylhydroperoxidase